MKSKQQINVLCCFFLCTKKKFFLKLSYLDIFGISLSEERKEMAKAMASGNEEATRKVSNDSRSAPGYSCNDKGFMDFSDQLMIGKRYVLQNPKKVEDIQVDHGKGRYGSVYCAHDKKENSYKAIKILKLPEKEGDDNYIRRELRVLKRITNSELGDEDNPKIGSPFVIQLLDYGQYETHSYFVFDYFEVTLQQHLDHVLQMNYKALQASNGNDIDNESNEQDNNGNNNANAKKQKKVTKKKTTIK
ncbi:hypothetical protein RFI_10992 [Reticulomyxa filosa]|uniref:Protein kinase domain-containing protein n=1 Tax=Reticulomyxa filosa TaxID=46433 RepID=X6NL84_RETFI|nr:hypothetical protein RFI_10992 [Reticulomyxa filosa]|eukprot:ETO26147.1 hypothetical protein RFI_10992 [Reticulomyxa filosa]